MTTAGVNPTKTFSIFVCALWLALGVITSSFAQVSQPHRYELKDKGLGDYFSIISLKREGLCVVHHKDKYNAGKRVWEFTLLDTALHEIKTTTFDLDSRSNFVGYEYTPGNIYFLYRLADTKNILELVEFNTQGEQKGHYEIKPELDFKLTHFIKAGAHIVLGGYVNKEPVILIYEMSTNLIKVVPGFFQKDNELVDLKTNENQTFNVVLIDRSTRSEKKMIFRTFDESGHLLLEDIIPIDERRSLQTPLTSTLEREELLVLGTWGDRQLKQANGFFSIKIDPFADQKINYFDLASLRHYLDYTKPKRAERIRKNSEEDLKAGRNPDFANYIMPYKIQEHQDGFLMLAEVYNPLSSSGQYNGYNGPYNNMGYGSPYYNPFYSGYYFPGRMYRTSPYSTGNNVKNADEVKTIQNVLLAFDGSGNLIWDYGMKISDLSRPALEQVTDFYYTDKKLYLVCKIERAELLVKSISTDRDDMQELKAKVMLAHPQDEFRSEQETEGGVRQWYDNSFYVWGYQTIRNESEENRVRDVFYINKVVVK